MKWSVIIGSALLFFALGLGPLINYAKESFLHAPFDPEIGQLPILSATELTKFYAKHRTLVVGGTRGIGRGIARVIVQSGGDVTVVGRSVKSGKDAVTELKSHAKSATQQISFIAGDLGTIKSAKELVRTLESVANKEGRFDYLVVTAAVFPDWEDLLQEDGLEKGHAIAVVGRYNLYRHMNLFLKEGGRVLNVMASGQNRHALNKETLEGKKNVTSLVEAILSWSDAAELMQVGVQKSGQFHKTTRVTTNPGLLSTELHYGQGKLFEIFEAIGVAFMGISEEQCGLNQASILASPRLHKGQLNYVDEGMKGRLRSAPLQKAVETDLDYLMAWLDERSRLEA